MNEELRPNEDVNMSCNCSTKVPTKQFGFDTKANTSQQIQYKEEVINGALMI